MRVSTKKERQKRESPVFSLPIVEWFLRASMDSTILGRLQEYASKAELVAFVANCITEWNSNSILETRNHSFKKIFMGLNPATVCRDGGKAPPIPSTSVNAYFRASYMLYGTTETTKILLPPRYK